MVCGKRLGNKTRLLTFDAGKPCQNQTICDCWNQDGCHDCHRISLDDGHTRADKQAILAKDVDFERHIALGHVLEQHFLDAEHRVGIVECVREHLYADVLAFEIAIRAIPVAGPLALKDRVLLRVNVLGPAYFEKTNGEWNQREQKTRPGQKREER